MNSRLRDIPQPRTPRVPDVPVRPPGLRVGVDGVVGPDAEVPQLERPGGKYNHFLQDTKDII